MILIDAMGPKTENSLMNRSSVTAAAISDEGVPHEMDILKI
jgi:hypothetical protein